MGKIKVIVSYSGGKDSQACLLLAVEKYKAENIVAVFCDTGWEHPSTYAHIIKTCQNLNVELVTVKSKKYDGMVDLAKKKKRFPSTMARFCTSELKSIPMIDYILKQKQHLIIIQGIRANESSRRAQMSKQCTFFKYYFEPYNAKGKTHTYRKKDIKKWLKTYSADILRPVFNWSGQKVIDYIIENKQTPNPLYYQGSKRVGCFPCMMTNHRELRAMIDLNPEWIEKINKAEIKVKSSFFPPDYIPKRFCSQKSDKGVAYPNVNDVVNYLTESTLNLFENDEFFNNSCMSFYSLCE